MASISLRDSSPFASLRQQDLEAILVSSPVLGTELQQSLVDDSSVFCQEHASPEDPESLPAWRLHATLLRLMLKPLHKVYARATNAAAASMMDLPGIQELEKAFRGEARGVYLWLHCAMAEEMDYGCPTCTTTAIFATETSVRIILTATLFTPFTSHQHSSTNQASPAPNFRPVLPALTTALHNDPFWSPQHVPHFLAFARRLANSLRDLQWQTKELEIMAAHNETPVLSSASETGSTISSSSSSNGAYGWSAATTTTATAAVSSSSSSSSSYSREQDDDADTGLIGVRMSRMAARQMRLREEEQMRRRVWEMSVATSSGNSPVSLTSDSRAVSGYSTRSSSSKLMRHSSSSSLVELRS